MTIILPKYRGIPDPQRPIKGPHNGYSGQAKVILRDLNLNIVYESPWQSNLITNNGLNMLSVGPFPVDYRFYIGSGNTPADVNDTQIETFLAQSFTDPGGGAFELGQAPDWEFWLDEIKRFGVGEGTGTVAEIAMGQSSNNTGTNIFNRVVLAAPVVKGADQVLDVVFRLTVWPPVIDLAGVSTVEGVAYNTITRGRDYNNWSGSGDPVYGLIEFSSGLSGYHAWSGDIGLITSSPAGEHDDLQSGGSASGSTYVPGDYFRDITLSVGLDNWNFTGGTIRSIGTKVTQFEWQTQFGVDPGATGAAIPKDLTEIMDFTFRVSWGRKP